MSITPKSSWPWVRALLQSVYDHPDAASVHAQFDRILDAVGEKLPAVAAHLDAARADVLAFTGFPRQIWRQIWSNNPKSGSTGRTAKREWLSPMFNASMDPDDPAFEQEEEPLQDAELYLLSKIDYSGSSPHMFFVSGDGQDGGPGSGKS
jgi:hypothetical protein